MNLSNFDSEVMLDFNWFLYKITERSNINMGFVDGDYLAENRHGDYDMGLGADVEYFHPTITLDDRMRYIGESISSADMSKNNIMCNTLISHFYGARGVHQSITQSTDPKNCWVDFDKLGQNDTNEINKLRINIDQAVSQGHPIWGTTELHTSIQTSAKNYVIGSGLPRKMHASDVCLWVASFKERGIINCLYSVDHIKYAYKIFMGIEGIGDYFAFHGAASTSVLKQTKYTHDDNFVAPGPGAKYACKLLWPDLKPKYYGDAICFLRENGDEIGLTDNVNFHPKAYNINGLFEQNQDGLKYYGTEVLCCQFGIYLQIRNNKVACDNRKVSRSSVFGESGNLERFM
tara:strand:- start:3012 stop:4049 length:1038 start_codon:yes stop_codon:yes gene_type:complete